MDELRVERVLRAVESIPAGCAMPYGRVGRAVGMPYGRVGRAVGESARLAARVLSHHGSAVPWWRVPNARGELPPPLMARALLHLHEEGTPLTADGRIDLRRAGLDEADYGQRVEEALADLPDAQADDEMQEQSPAQD